MNLLQFEISSLEHESICAHTLSSATDGGEAFGESGSKVILFALLSGSITLRIPELGVRRISAGDWCLVSDYGGIHSTIELAGARGFKAELEVEDILESISDLKHSRLACLVCPGRDSAIYLKGENCRKLSQLAEKLSMLPIGKISNEWMRRAYFCEFMARILEQPELQESPPCESCCLGKDLEIIEKVAQFLQSDLSGNHSISALSRTFFLNECKLKQIFKRHYGTTIFGFLRQKRMEAAFVLLKNEDTTVLEAANAVGYTNPSHFARAFRAVHARNPGDVKRGGWNTRSV